MKKLILAMALLALLCMGGIAQAQSTPSVELIPSLSTVAPGSTVNVSVDMYDSPGFTLTSMSAVILYDPTVFTYVDNSVVEGGLLAPFLTDHWDPMGAAGTPGELRIAAIDWSYPGGELLAAGRGTLFTFTLLANPDAPLGLSELKWGYADGGSGVDGFDYSDAAWNTFVAPSSGTSIRVGSVAGTAVPEPMSIMLGIMGLGSVVGFKRLRK